MQENCTAKLTATVVGKRLIPGPSAPPPRDGAFLHSAAPHPQTMGETSCFLPETKPRLPSLQTLPAVVQEGGAGTCKTYLNHKTNSAEDGYSISDMTTAEVGDCIYIDTTVAPGISVRALVDTGSSIYILAK